MLFATVAIAGAGGLLIYNNIEENRVKVQNTSIVTEFETKMEKYAELDEEGQINKDLSWLDYEKSIGTEYSTTIDGITYIGILYFPSISNLSVPIIDDCTDSLLKVSACRYFGSINEGNMIIFGRTQDVRNIIGAGNMTSYLPRVLRSFNKYNIHYIH